ncbi:hypothetical protein HWV62_19169 [Athelia sp. TMB]|nr:hypothetical protein HWV62_19169 [Athelia sp. TMB]
MASQGSDKENQPARAGDKHRGTALEYPERKRRVFLLFLDPSKSTDEICRICKTDPMVHVGQHFGRTIQKGIANSCGENTKGLKGVMIDWLTKPGVPLIPPLYRNSKSERGYNHPITGRLLCPAGWDWEDPNVVEGLQSGVTKLLGEHWPVFIYGDNTCNPEDPWKGAFRGSLLVKMYRHIFTFPSSVDLQEPKANQSGNVCIHGMTKATLASITYVATQVQFALSSHSVFSRSNCVTDTEQSYNTCMDLFLDKDDLAEINMLLLWWNRAALLAAATFNTSSNSGNNPQVPNAQPQLEPSPITTAGGLQAPVENGTSSGGGEA